MINQQQQIETDAELATRRATLEALMGRVARERKVSLAQVREMVNNAARMHDDPTLSDWYDDDEMPPAPLPSHLELGAEGGPGGSQAHRDRPGTTERTVATARTEPRAIPDRPGLLELRGPPRRSTCTTILASALHWSSSCCTCSSSSRADRMRPCCQEGTDLLRLLLPGAFQP